MSVEALFNELKTAQSNWAELYESLRRAQYDTSSGRAAIEGESVETLHRRAIFVFDLLSSLRPRSDDDVSLTALTPRVTEINSALSTFNSHVQTPLNQLRSYLRENVTIRDANSNFSWQFFEDQANLTNVDMSASFQQMYGSLNVLQNNIALLLPLCKANGVGDLSERSQAMAASVAEIERYRSDVEKIAINAATTNEKAAANEKSTQDVLTSAQTAYASIQATQEQVERENASITALVAQIKSTGTSADTLEQQIAGYRAKFDAFQSQLDDRLKQFSEFEKNVVETEQQNKKRESEIDRLSDKADSMIKGATTAGLSKSLEDTQAVYAKRMFISGSGFICAIILLAVSALPLAAHLLPGLLGTWIPAVADDVKNSPVSLLGKIVLLMPATWLTIFFSKAFSEFFHLEREYAHKAALAKAVEGFKSEAPDFAQEITTGVFGEILNNPSSRSSPEPANHPIYEVLTKHLTDWLTKKKTGI